MQVFHETIRILDPLLHPREKTPSQKLFLAWMSGGQEGMDREYKRMYPDGNAPASLKKTYEAMSLEGNSPAAQNLPEPVAK